MSREPVATRHIGGKPYYFYPHTTTSKAEAQHIADQLRAKGHKVRVLHVHSSWNRRWQYEIFTNPKSRDLELAQKFAGMRR